MAVQKQDAAFTDARPAAADLTGKEMYLVKDDGNGNYVLAGSGDIVAGVVQEGTPIGKWTSINNLGLQRVVAGGAISAGAKVQAGASGKVIAGTTNAIGTCRRDVNVDGEIAEIWFDRT